MIGPSKSKQIFIFQIIVFSIFLNFLNSSFALAKKDTKKSTYKSIIPKIELKINNYKNLFCGVYIKSSHKCAVPEININGDSEFPAASLIKIPIAVVLLKKIDKGEINWNKTLILSGRHYAQGAGILWTKKPGTKLKLKQVFKLMLTVSDNTATNMIIDLLGGVNKTNIEIQKLSKDLGLKNTRLMNPLGDFKGTNKTSPRDLVILLEKSLEGNLLKKDSQEILRTTLLRVKNKSLIKKGIGDHTKFAHKTGTIGICVGDAGLIYLPKNKWLGISIIVRRPFNSYNGQIIIREIAKIVYDALDDK